MWEETIANGEAPAIAEYSKLMSHVAELTSSPSILKQPQSDIIELYVMAGIIKPTFDEMVAEMGAEFQRRTGKKLKLSICDTLKKTSRMVEKGQLKATKKGSVSGVKDVVRAMVTGKTMADVNVVIEIVIENHKAKKLELVRIKDRFIEAPSNGGWRDAMLNIVLEEESGNKHICEIQVVHHQMLNARKEMAGHVVVSRCGGIFDLL